MSFVVRVSKFIVQNVFNNSHIKCNNEYYNNNDNKNDKKSYWIQQWTWQQQQTRLLRDSSARIQRNSWQTFFQSCSIFHLMFAYPLVEQNGRPSKWHQKELTNHEPFKKSTNSSLCCSGWHGSKNRFRSIIKLSWLKQ